MRRGMLFRALGFAFSVLPPLFATLELFPLMTVAGKISVLAIVGVALACVPFVNHLKSLLASPSAWMMWLIIFLLCVILRALVNEFYTISMLGLAGSVVGAVFFKFAKRGEADG